MCEEDLTPAETVLDFFNEAKPRITSEFGLASLDIVIVPPEPSDSIGDAEVIQITCSREGSDVQSVNQALSHCESVLAPYSPRHLRSGIYPDIVNRRSGYSGYMQYAVPNNSPIGGNPEKES
ncbi:hypothetical protein HY948_04275 [Candidatus Gottesmanbacteria bacterium]|nr:hypothetical protein [Candidatus Gottesmanbacteria bacterium]